MREVHLIGYPREVFDEAASERKELFQQTTVYINAGGRGTRLSSLFKAGSAGITKGLIEIGDKPMVQGHVDILSEAGLRNIIIGAGDHFDIKDYFKNKEGEGLSVVNTDVEEGTGGDLIKTIREKVDVGDNVLVENVDTLLYLDDLEQFLLQHKRTNATATMAVTTREGVPNEGVIFFDENGRVIFNGEVHTTDELIEPEEWSGRASSTGVVIFKRDFLLSFDWQSGDGRLSIYSDILPQLVTEGELFVYDNGDNFFMDIGTPDNYKKAKRHGRRIMGGLGDRYRRVSRDK